MRAHPASIRTLILVTFTPHPDGEVCLLAFRAQIHFHIFLREQIDFQTGTGLLQILSEIVRILFQNVRLATIVTPSHHRQHVNPYHKPPKNSYHRHSPPQDVVDDKIRHSRNSTRRHEFNPKLSNQIRIQAYQYETHEEMGLNVSQCRTNEERSRHETKILITS